MIIVSFLHSGFYNATAWVRFTIYYRSIFYWCVILIHPDANQSISLSRFLPPFLVLYIILLPPV